MHQDRTPQLDTQQIGRAAGQEAQPVRAFAQWYKVAVLQADLDGTAAGPNSTLGWKLVMARICDAAIATVGKADAIVAVPAGKGHIVGDLMLVGQPGGGTGMTYNGVAVNLCEIPGGIPPGTGRYKVLQIIDDLNPGGIGWDVERFS